MAMTAAAAAPHVTTFDPDTKYRLLLRVDAAEDLAHKSSQGAYCKLFVGDAAALDGSQKKLTKSASSESNGGGGDDHNNNTNNQDESDARSSFRTQTRTATTSADKSKSAAVTTWDETFEVALRDPSTEVLSLRVKSQHRFFCPVIGTFAVYLRHLRVGHQADQWFPLRRGKKDVGRIRLHLLITPESTAHGRGKKKRNGSDMAADRMVALAANFEADQAIQRLVDKQLKDEEARRQRRLRGEYSDDDDDIADANGGTSDQCTGAALAAQLDTIAVAKVKKEPVQLGSNRCEARFAVLLPPSPRAANGSVATPTNSSSSRHADALRADNFARLKQLEPIATAKEMHRIGDALGSGRGASGSTRQSLPTPNAALTNPVGSGAHPTPSRQQFFGADTPAPSVMTTTSTTVSAPNSVLTDAERNRRRAANFARLQDLDDAELAAGAPVATPMHVGSGRGSSRRSASSRPGSARGSGGGGRDLLYSIPSFGPDDLHTRSKRLSAASSTDSESLAAEYERRIDRKLRKVRKETEKLRKIKRQLRKYIPDLTDSDSDVSSSASASSSAASSPRASNNQREEANSRVQRHSVGQSQQPQQQPQRYYF